MALNLQDKKAIVDEISEIANNAISLVIADYRGLSGPDMTRFRSQARAAGVYLRVIRNTLAKKAFQGSSCECLDDHLVGPLVFGFSDNEPGAAAKLFKEFAKAHPKLDIKALALAGQYYEANQLDMVASLPSRNEAFQQLACMLISPVISLARLVGEPAALLARAVKAAGEKK